MKRLVSLFALAAVIISLFAFTSSTPVSAHPASVHDTCQVGCKVPVSPPHSSPAYSRGLCLGAGCDNQDPTQMHCLTNVNFHPYKKPEYYNGVVVGYITSVYSYNCNSNWDEAELTSDVTSQGWSIRTCISETEQVASQSGDPSVGVRSAFTKEVCYPEGNATDGTTSNGIVRNIGYGILAYNGATGWPTASNMVDGSGITNTEFMIFDSSGNRVVDDTTIQQ